jgi:hypothetical protein
MISNHQLNKHYKKMTTQKMTPHEAFIEWFNDFLTVEEFASHYGMGYDDALALIVKGREIEYGKGEA